MNNEVMTEVVDGVGVLTLNRPKAINALNGTMIGSASSAFDAWSSDPDVREVQVRGAGERGFCAGGQISANWRLSSVKAGTG